MNTMLVCCPLSIESPHAEGKALVTQGVLTFVIAGDGFVPGLNGLPRKMCSVRQYMSDKTLKEVKRIDERILRRSLRASRRDAGELYMSDESSEVLTVVPKSKGYMWE